MALAICSAARLHGQALDLSRYDLIDLTHPFDARTIYWPTAPHGFELQRLSYGRTEKGYFYSAYAFAAPEHGGTHIDAPIHFSDSGRTVDKLPLSQLMGTAYVIDVSDKATRNHDYRLSVADVQAFEREHGSIPEGAIVLLRTGWDRKWPDRKAYMGDDTPGDASHLHFPSFGAEAARLLVEQRRVAAIGVDVASIDYGQSTDFEVHQIAAAHDVVGFENLRGLEAIPSTGTIVIALPMKIENGSGGPLRAIAMVPRGARK
jgi:kynurenine formamidase